MVKKVKLRETARAEMSPDVYGGEKLDQVVPRWETQSDGDKGDRDWVDVLKLDARHFPAGTVVTIQEPQCPNCGTIRDVSLDPEKDGEPVAEQKCDCGFDWEEWTLEEYS